MAENLLNGKNPYLDGTGLSQVWAAIIANFVQKEAGKGLSANDLTNELLEKLNSIEKDAQVNVIEGIQVNGVDISIEGKRVNVIVPTGTLASLDKIGTEQLDTALAELINSHTTKTYVDDELAKKAAVATTLAGYGITDAYTKEQTYDKEAVDATIANAVKAAVAGVYKVKGSLAFTELSLASATEGDVYNVTDAFTTTADFLEGAGNTHPAGSNVVAVSDSGVLKWDVMAGTYDFSEFLAKDDIKSLSNEEIAEICVIK